MTRRLDTSAAVLLGAGVAIAAAMVVAFALVSDVVWGLACGAIVLVYTLVVVLGRNRSGTLEVLSGAGDERAEAIYLRASAVAGGLTITVIICWWIVAIAVGAQTTTLTILGAVFGAAFIVASAVLQRRS
ncbi:MAG TPA: hypothetical protein VLK58_00495 [Conexibacter sp.]|nr:hypothetical protein [Conexibacter sp.]